MTITADLYMRLSDGRKENGTFAEREAKLRARAKTLGWTVSRVVIENDITPGGKAKPASAYKRRKVTLPDGTIVMRVVRPGFRSVLDDIAAGRVGAVLAEDFDRTIRDGYDSEEMLDIFRAARAHAESDSGSLRLTAGGTDSEQMMFRLLAAFSHKSSQDTARRVAAGRERTASKAQWGGGRRPFGFRPVQHPEGDHKNTKLVIDEAEAQIIRDACASVLNNISLRQIARDLRDAGVPTVTGVQWRPDTLRAMLIRPLNAGTVVYRGAPTGVTLADGAQIIDEDMHRAVVAKLTDPERCNTPGPAAKWLGSGVYRCAECGGGMRVHTAGSHKGRPTYRCAEGRGKGHVGRVAGPLDAYVADVVCAWFAGPDAGDAADLFLSGPAEGIDESALRAERKALEERLEGFAADCADGFITREQLRTGTARLKPRIAEIDKALELVAPSASSPVAELIDAGRDGDAGAVREVWDAMALGKRRAIIAKLLRITILPTGRGKGFRPESVRITRATRG